MVGIDQDAGRPGGVVHAYLGVYSRCLRLVEDAGRDDGVDARTIRAKIGERVQIGSQEDMILDIVLNLVTES